MSQEDLESVLAQSQTELNAAGYTKAQKRLFTVLDQNTLAVMRSLKNVTEFETEVCPGTPVVEADSCFETEEIGVIDLTAPKSDWERILGLDWVVFDFLKSADDKTLEAFDFDTGVDPKKRWYKDVDAGTYLLLNTLDTYDELWTLKCLNCIKKYIALHLDELDEERRRDLTYLSKDAF
jgi:hypothetical protein